jgi:predicted phosphodiesterase
MGKSDLKHRLVAEVKEIASLLGHTPTRDEYRQYSKIGEKAYRKAFGGYTPLIMAAGLKTYAEKQDLFVAPIGSIQLKTGILKPTLGIKGKILVIGDTHFPWVHQAALEGVYSFIKSNLDITHVVQVGDLFDMYSWSKFPRSQMLYTPKAEIDLARQMAETMWSKISGMLPKAKLYQITGNHCARPMKRVMELAPEMEIFVEFSKWYQFDGVETIMDPREWLVIEGIKFTHGHLSGLGSHARREIESIVCGHTHVGGVWYQQLNNRVIFELNAGYLGDPDSRPMGYTAKKTVNWTLGFGVIDQYGPRFISF